MNIPEVQQTIDQGLRPYPPTKWEMFQSLWTDAHPAVQVVFLLVVGYLLIRFGETLIKIKFSKK